MSRDEKKALLEAILFLESEGIDSARLIAYTGFSEEEFAEIIAELKDEYEIRSGGLEIAEAAGVYQMRAHPRFSLTLSRLFGTKATNKLSRTSLEVLAIVAYKQPITRAEIEEVRGVSSEYAIKNLLEKDLIGMASRRDSPGKPLQFATTKNFLKVFGLTTIRDLPKLRELKDLEFEIREKGNDA